MRIRPAALLLVAALIAACGSPAVEPAEQVEPEDQSAPSARPAASGPVTAPATDEGMIESAMSAAPVAVSSNATIMAMNEQMEMRTLRQGTNGWTCLPDMPHSPGADPMCLDANAVEWVMAWMSRQDPPQGQMGFGYMLVGGSDASNEDPFAEEPAPGGTWVDTGPHVMIFGDVSQFEGYPTSASNTKVPYVMFPNTPYAHLMIPVE